MKVSLLTSSLFFLSFTFFTACNSGETNQKAAGKIITQPDSTDQTETNRAVAGVTYTCPMHPEVTSLEPGKCPKCGMNLEKATAEKHEHAEGDQH